MEGKSIEDLILERYASELGAEHAMSKRMERSPYQLPLSHSNILSSYKAQSGSCNSNRSHKSRSAKPASERSRSTDLGRAPPHTPKDSEASLRHTPVHANRRSSGSGGQFVAKANEPDELDLAVVHNSQDLQSAKDESARHSRMSTGRKKVKTKATYLLKPEVYVVNAFKNGDTVTGHRVSASSFERLFEECTQRLNLPSSARKLFLSSGKEVTKDILLPRGIDVYVSMGELFKDPLKMFEKKLSIKADMQWTLTGLNLPSGRDKETTKPLISSTRLEGNRATKRRILVFPNGKGIKGMELIADMTNIEDFLQSCTFKLKSGQLFRRVLLLDGQEVNNLHTVPIIHHFFNTSSAPLLGPVWLSKGENISPMGVEEYLRDSIDFVGKLKSQCDRQLAQLNAAYYCDDRSSLSGDPQLTDKRILSLSHKELEQKIAKESEKHDEYVAFLTEFKAKVREVEPKARSELEEGSQFTMKHISALPENHRLVADRRGIRLKVYNNGRDSDPVTVYFNMREASRGLAKDKDRTRIVFQRFLDSLSANPQLASQSNKSKGILVQRIFAKSGIEISDALALQYDDEVWISNGENWIDPFTYCLQAEISRITMWKKGGACHAVRSDIPLIDDSLERPSAWDAQWQLPDDVEKLTLEEEEEEEETEEEKEDDEEEDDSNYDDEEPVPRSAAAKATKAPSKPPEGSVPADSCFLQHSRNRKLCLFVEPVVGVMKVPHESSVVKGDDQQIRPVLPVWPKAGIAQSWVIHKTGQISVKGFPGLALAVSDCEVETSLNGVQVRGSLVQFCPFELDEFQVRASQQWIFHTDGLVYSKQHSDQALTYLSGSIDELSSCPKNGLNPDSGYRNFLAVCEPLDSRLAKYQRFGIRQQKLGNLGQLRKAARFRDPAWSKLAIMWPTDHQGNWIEEYDWPIEGYILTFAPPIKYKPEGQQRKRLYCLKNGERKEEAGTFIVAPDLTNMKKDRQLLKRQTTRSRRIRTASAVSDADSIATTDEFSSAETDQKVSEVQFQIFMESCTSKLGLSAEARRLFDRNGVEHTTLKHLESDQVVYISTGEDWIDPKFTKSQLEARSLLSKLSDDVEKMRCFVALRKSTRDLALSAQSLTYGARINVTRDASVSGEDPAYVGAGRQGNGVRDSEDGKLTKLRWPWERIVSTELEDCASRRRRVGVRDGDALKQFGYEDGYIFSLEDSGLVLTAIDTGAKSGLEVNLQRRRPDNVYQRWQLSASGFIVLKYQSGSALTLQLPKVSTNQLADAETAMLTVQPQVSNQFGRAHQLFSVDAATSTIRCFVSNPLDVAVTVAIHCGCCTSSVVLPKDYEMDQPGYTVYLPVEHQSLNSRRDEARMKRCEVCAGCAKSLRGRYKLQRIGAASRGTDFACAFAQASALGLKETGAFRLLGGKLDLTDGEDAATLSKWERELEERRQSLSLKAINERLSEARTPRPIRVLAYRNGEGRQRPPVLVTGSSAAGLMDQCMLRLNTNEPVLRLFLEDGTEVREVTDLRRWRNANAKLVRRRQREMTRQRDAGSRAEASNDEEEPQSGDESASRQVKEDDLEPRLTPKYFVIGKTFTAPSAYNLGISLYSMSFLDEILPEYEQDDNRQLAVRYSIFDQTLCTDPFAGEETFEGEKREILVKSELQILRRYFREKFRLLKLDLVQLAPEESVLATCYVPLDSLIREEHEEFINSTKMAADYAWYRKSARKPKGERTHASMHVEVSITVSIDVDVEEDDDEQGDGSKYNNETEQGANQDETSPEDDDAVVEVWASLGEDFVQPKRAPPRRSGGDAAAAAVAVASAAAGPVSPEPRLTRLRVYQNGENPSTTAVTIWAESVQQALENATARLGLRRPGRVLYDSEGRELRDPLTDLTTSELLCCVSLGEPFQQVSTSKRSTSHHVAHPPQPPPPTFDTKRILVSSRRGESDFATVWGDSLEALLKAATQRLRLRTPAVSFYRADDGRRVENFADISRDERLLTTAPVAAAVKGSAAISSSAAAPAATATNSTIDSIW